MVTTAEQASRHRVRELIEEAWNLRETEQWDKLLATAAEAKRLAEEYGDQTGVSLALSAQGFVHYIRSDFQTALSYCMDALKLSYGHVQAEGRARGILAMVHWSLGNYDEALKQGDRSLELLARAGDSITEAFAFSAKGGILHGLGEYMQALEWNQRALQRFEELGDEIGKSRALALLGSTYLALGNIDDALSCHLESLQLAQGHGHKITISRALNDLGDVFEALDNDDRALEYHLDALKIRQQEGYRQAETTSLLAVGRIHARRGEHTRAIELFRRCLEIAEELGLRPRIAHCHQALADAYERSGDIGAALRHFKEYEHVKSELAADQAALRYRALALQTQLETFQRSAETEKLAALGSLVAALAHEINSPLGAIRSSGDVVLRAAEKLTEGASERSVNALRTNSRVIADASRRIEELVNRLKSFAGIDQAAYAQIDLVKAIEDTVALIRPEFDGRVTVSVETETVPRVYGFAAELSQVFMNLLRNALEAIPDKGSVTVRLSADSSSIRVAFRDTGRGIVPDHLPHIFTPGFTTQARRVKASLSLFTCLNIVRRHGGTIEVDSTPGRGSTFTVVLPRRLENADPQLEGSTPAARHTDALP
ncbi:MAG TPA: tetratricopeptide repeat-containing sensor histidine kinase [Bryobacteraceae bacterium]|nr:tetratricopeptide repeat-containing sensor histidine kinase [Bryobacteraceae bacterium]